MTRKITFDVHGKPQPAGSKRGFVVKGRAILTDANPKAKDWKSLVSFTARQAYHGPPLEGAVALVVVFTIQRPKSHLTTKGLPSSQWREFPTVKPDATKLLRGTEDALTGIAWKDDSQVVRQKVYKQYGEQYVTSISVEEI